MKTRMQRAFGVEAEPAGERKVSEEEEKPARAEPKSSSKGDPYPTLPRRSLIRAKRPDEDE